MSEPGTHSLRTQRPLKFIQVFNRYLQVAGEENSVARIARHLEAAGHEVHRFWRASAEWQEAGAPSRLRQPLLMFYNRPVLESLRQLHEQVQPHAWILHNVIPVVSLGVYGLARALGVPVIQWLHNYRPISPSGTLWAGQHALDPAKRWIAWRETFAGSWRGMIPTAWLAYGYYRLRRRGDFACVRAWVAVSEEMRGLFLRGGWNPEHIFTLHHSWDIQPPAAPESSDAARCYFVFLGRMAETKGVRFLIDLWKEPALREVELVMAGEGPLARPLRRVSPPNVRWVGFVSGEAKRRLIAGCRAVLFPCQWAEPLSTVAYEAYEQARPILCSRLGGMKELIQDGVTGRLLPATDRRAWIEAVRTLIDEAAQSDRMGHEGRRWLETHVSPAAWIHQFDHILERALPEAQPLTARGR